MSQEVAPSSATSTSSSVIMENEKVASPKHERSLSGHGESALPEDKVEEALENEEHDWENDPENARNWSWGENQLNDGPWAQRGRKQLWDHELNHHGSDVDAPIACGGGTIGDLFSDRERASAMAVYTLGPLIGPVVGPIAGGFISESMGIKWVFLIISILCGVASIVGIPFLRETYAPIIRVRKAKRSDDPEALVRVQRVVNAHEKNLRFLWDNLSRPIVMLFRSFICFILSLYMAFLYGIYYLMFATFAEIFQVTYGFGPGIGGLAYIGLGVGFFLATLFGAKTADQVYKYLADKNGGKGKPEMRIPALFFGSFFVPIGLFWYGWSADAGIHWIMPIIGSGIFGFGMMSSFLPIQLYLVDAFRFAASATAAAAVFRSMLGFGFPLFGQQMFAALGLGGGNSVRP
ncbi:hypothetical protein C0989_003627 [Termitomyces sp. Mn162]|nr:hypothetical protein C0989_003627 [Termitomyces sp. Mn162]